MLIEHAPRVSEATLLILAEANEFHIHCAGACGFALWLSQTLLLNKDQSAKILPRITQPTAPWNVRFMCYIAVSSISK